MFSALFVALRVLLLASCGGPGSSVSGGRSGTGAGVGSGPTSTATGQSSACAIISVGQADGIINFISRKVAPASHWAASNSSSSLAAPIGMRLRLKANDIISRSFSYR
jgi:hypothetical protein